MAEVVRGMRWVGVWLLFFGDGVVYELVLDLLLGAGRHAIRAAEPRFLGSKQLGGFAEQLLLCGGLKAHLLLGSLGRALLLVELVADAGVDVVQSPIAPAAALLVAGLREAEAGVHLAEELDDLVEDVLLVRRPVVFGGVVPQPPADVVDVDVAFFGRRCLVEEVVQLGRGYLGVRPDVGGGLQVW